MLSAEELTGPDSNQFTDDGSDIVGGTAAQPNGRVDDLVVRGVGKRRKPQRPVAERLQQSRHDVHHTPAVRPDPRHGRRRATGGRARQQRACRVDEDHPVGESAGESRRDRSA